MMRLILMDGGRAIFQQDLTPDQGVQVRSYAQSLSRDARAAQQPQRQESLPPNPQDEMKARMNSRPSRPGSNNWWNGNGTVGNDNQDAVFNRDQQDDV